MSDGLPVWAYAAVDRARPATNARAVITRVIEISSKNPACLAGARVTRAKGGPEGGELLSPRSGRRRKRDVEDLPDRGEERGRGKRLGQQHRVLQVVRGDDIGGITG